MKNEPAIIIALVAAVLGLAASFGLSLTADQTAAIMALVTLLAGLVTRSQVSPKNED